MLPRLPLAGRRILVTRTREQSSALAARLRHLGAAEVLEVPTIRIVAPVSYASLDGALAQIDSYDVLLVTSVNTARVLAARRPPPWPIQPFTASVGPATAAVLRELGLRSDLEPEPAVAESLVRELAPSARGRRMLLPQAAEARDLLPGALREAGATVDVIEAYRNELAEESRTLLAELFSDRTASVDAVTFTSSSTVENFFRLLDPERGAQIVSRTRSCSIGPITSNTLRRHGWEPTAEATTHDMEGLVAALVRLLGA